MLFRSHFVVWAPNAVAVSLVCDSNGWDHRRNLMERVGSSGIFELFLPGLGQGEVYKYAIKHAGGRVTFKADPYGFVSELRPNNANVVWDMDLYFWQDGGWSEENKACIRKQMPMVIYEMQMGSFIQEDTIFPNYREVADDLVV